VRRETDQVKGKVEPLTLPELTTNVYD